MGGSPLPTVAKIKNLVYMNAINEETGVNSREQYLGKCVCHHSARSPIDKQQYPFTLTHLTNPLKYVLFQTFIFSASGQRSMTRTWSPSLRELVTTISSKWRTSQTYRRPLMRSSVCCHQHLPRPFWNSDLQSQAFHWRLSVLHRWRRGCWSVWSSQRVWYRW